MSDSHETLYERTARLTKGRWLLLPLAVGVPVFIVTVRAFLGGLSEGASLRSATLFSVVTLVGLAVMLATRGGISLGRTRRPTWEMDRRLAAQEVAEAEQRDPVRVPESASRLFKGDVDAIDQALETYQIATGQKVFPHFERLPRSVYRERVDACVRMNGAEPLLCFTPAMLERFDSPMLLAVIAHLLVRAELMRKPTSRVSDGVCEADTRTLLITRDHVALLRALEASRVGSVGMARPGDAEAWFSEDEAVLDHLDDEGEPVFIRVDRLADLRRHLGVLALDAPEAPADVRLGRLFDTESGMLTDVAREGLRDV